MEHLLTQTRAAFPDSGWACWSPRPGTSSEHPLGRACDVTFGNTIGTAASYGCFRMHNQDVADLYARVRMGTPVVVLP